MYSRLPKRYSSWFMVLLVCFGSLAWVVRRGVDPSRQNVKSKSKTSLHLEKTKNAIPEIRIQVAGEISGSLPFSEEASRGFGKEINHRENSSGVKEQTRIKDQKKQDPDLKYNEKSDSVSSFAAPSNIVWVQGSGTLVDRLESYTAAISKERNSIIGKSLLTSEWVPLAKTINPVWGNDFDTIYRLQNYSIVRTVALQWLGSDQAEGPWNSMEETRNLLVQKYYGWAGNDKLCSHIRRQGGTKAHWDAAYNRTCTTDPTVLMKPQSLEKIYLNAKPISRFKLFGGKRYPEEYYTRLPLFVLYVHIVQSGVIDGVGDVFTKDLKIVPYTCSHNLSPKPPNGFMDVPVVDEVFVITQYWGAGFFHKMEESLPRLAPYVKFLKANPEILIHVAENEGVTRKVFEMLGLDPARMILGVRRAKIVYLPQGTYCGYANVPEMQLLSNAYRKVIAKSSNTTTRNSVVVIRRSSKRKFSQFQEIENTVKTLSEKYGFSFELYPDKPMPPFEEAMKMFNRAAMVVGPHGAGLANLLFCEPGTVVIEAVCNPPHINMCYQRTAHILGLRYHGIGSYRGCEGVVDIPPETIGAVVETHMKLLQRTSPER